MAANGTLLESLAEEWRASPKRGEEAGLTRSHVGSRSLGGEPPKNSVGLANNHCLCEVGPAAREIASPAQWAMFFLFFFFKGQGMNGFTQEL
jgi:hypothetical protein